MSTQPAPSASDLALSRLPPNLPSPPAPSSPVGWNFGKFLVRPDGTVFGRYAPTTGPLSLEKYIVELINSR